MRLTVREVKPLKPKAAKTPMAAPPYISEAGRFVLALDCRKHQPSELEKIREILYANPGSTAVHFRITLPSDKNVILAASEDWQVEDTEEVRSALQPWLT
jgi:hypothetical protein